MPADPSFRRGVAWRPGRLLLVVFSGVLLGSCAGVTEPRWAGSDGPDGATPAFVSPRETIEVRAKENVGSIRLIGVIESLRPSTTAAEVDGTVSNVRIEPGTVVEAGVDVLDFLPALGPDELIERQILELEIELAMERHRVVDSSADDLGADDVARAEEALAAFDAAHENRVRTISSPASGRFDGARQNITYPVRADDVLFIISDEEDLVAQLTAGTDADLSLESTVVVSSASGVTSSPGMVASIEPAADPDRLLISITLDDQGSFALGDAVDIELAVADSDVASVWVRRDAVHRSAGASFVLVEGSGGALRRVELVVRQRTETHVEVALDDPQTAALLVPGARLVLP